MQKKIFDAHFHIIDPDFPLIANQGFLPEPFQASDIDLLEQVLNEKDLDRVLWQNAIDFYRIEPNVE